MGLLRDSLYRMEFSPEAILRIGRLVNTGPMFMAYYTGAMRQSVALVSRRAKDNAPVLTGTLRRGVRGQVITPWQGRVGVISNVAYARRREFGFDGQTDAAGRTFANGDPLYSNPDKRAHMMYLHRALEASRPEIAAFYRTATQTAIRQVIL